MSDERELIRDLIGNEGARADDFANAPLPEAMWAVTLHQEDEERVKRMPRSEKDPASNVYYEQVPLPPLQQGEVLVAVMASGINHNTVWSALFEPLSNFSYLAEFARLHPLNAHHLKPYLVVGSDAAGVVLRCGPGVAHWAPGDRVAIFPAVFGMHRHQGYRDSMLDPDLRAWGFETNYGGLAEFTVVRESQLMPKPEALSWEEAASLSLVSSTCYRMLVSENGAQMRQGDNVMIWGATGGLGALATQYVLNGGGTPIAIVSSADKVHLARRQGCQAVIDRSIGRYQFIGPDGELHMRSLVKFRRDVLRQIDDEVDIVFEHVGRETFGASVFVARTGGKIVTCGSTSGYNHVYDNRFFWMRLKRIIGSHGANYHEAWQANRLSCQGRITPVLSRIYTLDHAAEAVDSVYRNRHIGKLGVLCLARCEGQGIKDNELREQIGEDRINLFREPMMHAGTAGA